MNRESVVRTPRCGPLTLSLVLIVVGVGGCSGPQPKPAPQAGPSQSQGSVVLRVKAASLPPGTLTAGKGPDDLVELTCPGRVYDPPRKIEHVTRSQAERSTPEKASASDFSAFRADDPEWIRENYATEDHPQIQRMVEDRMIRKLNQQTFRNYRSKTVAARCSYREYALVFIRYDDAVDRGTIEIYKKVKTSWKRTNALAEDETLAAFQSAFRSGEVLQRAPGAE